jgi:hypothetical protein
MIIISWSLSVYPQQNYTVSWGISSYDTLVNFSQLDPEDENDINFNFNFLYFNDPYESVTLDIDGYGYFQGSPDYNLFMFAGDFEFHQYSGLPIHSDWRYNTEIINGLEVIKVEWRNVGISNDIWSSNPTDHKINYQVWFYENGIIEIHFGEIDLENSPFFTNTAGFIWEDGETYGPWIVIGNFDLSEIYCVSGTSSNVNIITEEDSADIFYGIPPYGQYFRWVPDEVSGFKPQSMPDKENFIVYPNPGRDEIKIKTFTDNLIFDLFDIKGNKILSQKMEYETKIITSHLEKGIYTFRISNQKSETIETGKWIKE